MLSIRPISWSYVFFVYDTILCWSYHSTTCFRKCLSSRASNVIKWQNQSHFGTLHVFRPINRLGSTTTWHLTSSMIHYKWIVNRDTVILLHWTTLHSSSPRFTKCTETSYRQILWRLEAARLDVMMIVSLWNLTGISAALLPICLSNFRAIGKV